MVGICDHQIKEWKNGVSEYIRSLKMAHTDVSTDDRTFRPSNLHSFEFPAPLELISLRICEWAQGDKPLDSIFDIARDMFDIYECNQDICEKAERQTKKAKQRIPSGLSLGLMISALNESIDTVEKPKNTHPMVVEAMSRVWEIEKEKMEFEINQLDLPKVEKIKALKKLKTEEKRRTEPTARYQKAALAKMTDAIGLHLPERSLLNVILHLVAVVVAISNKDLRSISIFGDNKKDYADLDRKMIDKTKIEIAFKVFCPDQILDKSKASVLVFAIVKALTDEGLSDEHRSIALEAMFVIFDDRLANDKILWEEVDSFSLVNAGSSEKKYFSDGSNMANRRRYLALNHALILFLGKQYGEVIAATDGLECDGEEFQLAFLRSSISILGEKVLKSASSVKPYLFSVSTFTLGHFNGMPCFEVMKAILDQSRQRKCDFCASKTILNDLDVNEDSINDVVLSARRVADI